MSLIIQPAIPGAAQTRAGTLPAPAVVAARDATGGAGVGAGASTGTVAFSPVAVLLAQLQAGAAGTTVLPAPGSEPAAAMTMLLAQRLGALLRDAGLPAGAALAFEVGGDDQVRVASRRPDVAQLQALVDAHPDVQVLVRLLHAINTGPVAALTTATLAAERRGAADDIVGAATTPAPPMFNAWGWWGATPRRRATPADQWVRLAWLAAAVLALLGLALWQG